MSSVLEYKNYVGTAEFSAEDEVFHGRLEGIRDLVTYQATEVEGLKKAFRAAVEDYFATCRKLHKEPDVPFKGTFNVRLRPELHRRAAVYSTAHNLKLNNVVSAALEKYLEDVTP